MNSAAMLGRIATGTRDEFARGDGRGGAFSEQPWRGLEANGGIELRRDFRGPILLGHLAVDGEIRVRTIVSARATPGHADMRGKGHIVVM